MNEGDGWEGVEAESDSNVVCVSDDPTFDFLQAVSPN
jgi:hypothetical protein